MFAALDVGWPSAGGRDGVENVIFLKLKTNFLSSSTFTELKS